MTNLTRRQFLTTGTAAAVGIATATTVAPNFVQAATDTAHLENQHGVNIQVKFGSEALANNIKNHYPEFLHEVYRDGIRRTERSPDTRGPNSSGYERDVARAYKNYRVPAEMAARVGLPANSKLGDYIARNGVKVWENQENLLPATNDPSVVQIQVKVSRDGSRAGVDNARGNVDFGGGTNKDCYAGVPLNNSEPIPGITRVHGNKLCPGGQ